MTRQCAGTFRAATADHIDSGGLGGRRRGTTGSRHGAGTNLGNGGLRKHAGEDRPQPRSPDTVRNVARSVVGKNAFDTEMIWQAAFMDGFYSPGKERLHALGAIDLALWDIKGNALNAPLYQLFGGKAREHIELYATLGLPQGGCSETSCFHSKMAPCPPLPARRTPPHRSVTP